MSTATDGSWPAEIIHVNEDGWVLINRGSSHGATVGLRLLVVGQGVRELRNLFTPGAVEGEEASAAPPVLRIRRTYEELEIIHAEAECSIAVAARALPERRPHLYRGTDGELLVWVPLPSDFTWPEPGSSSSSDDDADDSSNSYTTSMQSGGGDGADGDEDESGDMDTPPERDQQEDERWEHALPLNDVGVGDLVVPAIPEGGAS